MKSPRPTPTRELDYCCKHRSHDCRDILRRWRAAVKKAGLKTIVLGKAAGFPVYLFRSARLEAPALYLSAGIHGDEAAPVQALLEWAEENPATLARTPLVLCPLLNPAGLRANTRLDGNGDDLNRCFHDPKHPLIAAWHAALRGIALRLSVTLHEDYDAQGVYAYEMIGSVPQVAETLVTAAARYIPRDTRRKIDGRAARGGIIARKFPPLNLPGLPEAIALFLSGSISNLTFETPSEFSLLARVQAHKALIQAAVKLVSEK